MTSLWFSDVRHPLNRSRRVSGFYTPSALNELLARNVGDELARLNDIREHGLLRRNDANRR